MGGSGYSHPMSSPIARRQAVAGTAAVCLGSPLLAACGGSDSTTGTDPAGSGGDASSSGGDGSLASTADVPVGGCFVVSGAKVVLTQPAEGEFKAFDSTCPHQGCAVSNGTDGVIPCKCHGSEFSLEDGSVVGGPAPRGLEPVEISVEGDQISRA